MSKYSLKIGDKIINVELNKFAKQANGSVMLSCQDTRILSTSTSKKSREDIDFFPLIINYEERMYASGKIPTNYPRREGRPSDEATLAARLIDRPIRPLFPKGYTDEVQVVNTVMSYDEETRPEVLAITASSLSLLVANEIPFTIPTASVAIGLKEGGFLINPSEIELETSELNLVVAGTKEAINMVEAQANELSEEVVIEAIMYAHEIIKDIIIWQEEIVKEEKIEKVKFINKEDEGKVLLEKNLNIKYGEKIKEAIQKIDKQSRQEEIEEILDLMIEETEEEGIALNIKENLIKEKFRELIINDKKRVDGRRLDEIRPLSSELSLLPRAHGSSMFTRGQTQVMSTVTLGLKSDEQYVNGLKENYYKNFLLHYNFPPYSVGEAGRIGTPGRREIGHGNLAERALSTMMPTKEDFPYTIRIVSDVLESNGSSSQATICSGSMALMQAGVPIKKQVAGIAMGLISDENDYSILTDIQGLEDHYGDMDFKVAGTNDGICAIQMDIKISGITKEILSESLEQARVGRLSILEHMNGIISKPNDKLSDYAPKVEIIKIEENQIKEVIGRGGETINKIIEQTNVKIDIEEDGTIYIYGKDYFQLDQAKNIILEMTKTYKVGEQFQAKVFRIESFGAFVMFDGKTEALLHISNLSKERVEKVEDVINLNDIIQVEIINVDEKKRIKVKLVIKESENGE